MWLTDNYDVASVRGVTFDKMKDYPEGNSLGPWDPDNFDVEDTAMAMITMKNGLMIYVDDSMDHKHASGGSGSCRFRSRNQSGR